MTPQERVTLALQHKKADRIPIQDSLWGTPMARCRGEGMPDDKPLHEYFGWEMTGFGGDVTLRLPDTENTEPASAGVSFPPFRRFP